MPPIPPPFPNPKQKRSFIQKVGIGSLLRNITSATYGEERTQVGVVFMHGQSDNPGFGVKRHDVLGCGNASHVRQ
jgi:hypothetical protein